MGGDDESQASRFQAVGNGQWSDRNRVGQNGGTGRAAHGAEMVRGRREGQVGAKMELRAKEHDREEQSQDVESSSVLMHVVNRTELREEWLRGQGVKVLYSLTLDTILGDSMQEGRWHTRRRTKRSF